MLKHGFDMHRVFLSAPGDLERERDACRSVISDVNAADAMPVKILLVTVGLTSDEQIVGFRSAVAENIRAMRLLYSSLRGRLGSQKSIPENILSSRRVPRRWRSPHAGSWSSS